MSRTVKHLIVGWSRGGLGYVTKLLREAGEDVGQTFDADTTADNLAERIANSHSIEVSPFIVPFIGHELLKGTRVTFIIRDPMRVLNSLYFHGLFHNERTSKVMRSAFKYLSNFEKTYKGKPAQAGAAYLHNWLKLAKEARSDLDVMRVEEGPDFLLHKLVLKRMTEDIYCPPDVNASYCKQTIVPSTLPEKSQWGMLNLLAKLGYKESLWFPRGGHAHYMNPDWHC